MPLLLAALGSYLVGSVPTAYLMVRWLKRVDVRSLGSGNVGATNATRAAGLPVGVAVFLLDVGKGLLAVHGFASWAAASPTPALRLACGLAAVLGHSFPVFLGFRGGKGVATTIGVLLGASPLVAAACAAAWLFGFLPGRYVSVGSLTAAAALPIAQTLLRRPAAEIAVGAALAALVIARHRANIQRLLAGTEHRMGRRNRGASNS